MITWESNEELCGRLMNWKFSQAEACIENESDDEILVIVALSRTFGNCGWINGNMGTIIEAAINSIAKLEDI